MRFVDENMTFFKLSPTTIVLSLVASLSPVVSSSPPRVLSLQTGYVYNTGENPTTAEMYKDLKCGYLMTAVTHMGLVKLILSDKTIPTGVAVGLMIKFNIRAVICTLYGVDAVEIGSLWQLLLYASTMKNNYDFRVSNEVDESKKAAVLDGIMAAHKYVTAGMQRELSAANCRPGNRFGWYNEQYERRMAAMPSGQLKKKHLQNVGFNNCHVLDKLLEENDAQSTYESRYAALSSKNLFINKLGTNTHVKFMLMNAYDVQVSWGRVSEMLKDDYENAHMMNSITVNFLPLLSIKMYYNRVFTLLKGVMSRLMWKCLLHVNTCQQREEYLTKSRDFLIEFQQLLRLYDDPDVLVLLDRLSTSVVDVDDVINQIRLQLSNINVILQCEAANEPTLKPEQLSAGANQGTSGHADHIVATTKAFIEDITFAFQTVDFDVIRSIVTYVDKNYLLTM